MDTEELGLNAIDLCPHLIYTWLMRTPKPPRHYKQVQVEQKTYDMLRELGAHVLYLKSLDRIIHRLAKEALQKEGYTVPED